MTGERQVDQVERADSRGRKRIEFTLVSASEPSGIEGPARIVVGKVEARALARDLDAGEIGLLRQDVAKSGAVVIGAKDDVEAACTLAGFAQGKNGLVVGVACFAGLADDEAVESVDG